MDPDNKPGFAVFSRNHLIYLKEATSRGNKRTTFRSKVRWVSARNAIRTRGACTIYFAVIDGNKMIEYEADLVHVQVGPSPDDAETGRLLSYELKLTKEEKLWSDTVQTLYTVANCKKIKKRFSQMKLRKLSNNQCVDKNYVRSYAIVYPV